VTYDPPKLIANPAPDPIAGVRCQHSLSDYLARRDIWHPKCWNILFPRSRFREGRDCLIDDYQPGKNRQNGLSSFSRMRTRVIASNTVVQ
jgi:hypothetical protein